MKKIVKPFIALAFASILASCGQVPTRTTSTPSTSTPIASTSTPTPTVPSSSTPAPTIPSTTTTPSTPTPTIPSTSTPVASTPAPSTPVVSTPVPSTPTPSTPVVTTPTPTTPAITTPTPTTPVASTPAPTTPAITTPTPTTPVASTPAPTTPAITTPTPTTPVASTPAPTTPAQSTPESTPEQSTPVPSTPTTPTGPQNVADAITSFTSNASLVSDGSYNYKTSPTGSPSVYTYKYGEDASKKPIFEYTLGTNTYSYFYEGETPKGVRKTGENLYSATATDSSFKGLSISNIIASASGIYGMESAISYLYTAGKTSTETTPVFNFTESYEAPTGTFSFSYGKIVNSSYYCEIDVKFELDENGWLSSYETTNKQYWKTKWTYVDGTFTLSDTTVSNHYIHSGTQTSETKLSVAPYGTSTFYFSSFDLTDDDEKKYGESITDVVEIDIGILKLNLENAAPDTVSLNFDKITVTATDLDEKASSNVSGFYNDSTKTVTIDARVAGEYIVTISSTNVTKKIRLSVKSPAITGITVTSYFTSINGYSPSSEFTYDDDTGIETYQNSTIFIPYSLTPSGAIGEVTPSILGGVSSSSAEVGISGEYITFTGYETGTYTVHLATGDVTKDITIQVSAAPTDIISGKTYAIKGWTGITLQYEFTATSATEGTCEIYDRFGDTTNISCNYSIDSGTITFTDPDEVLNLSDYELTIGSDYNVYHWDEDYEEYTRLSLVDGYFLISNKSFSSNRSALSLMFSSSEQTVMFNYWVGAGSEDNFEETVSYTLTDIGDGKYTIHISGISGKLDNLINSVHPITYDSNTDTITIYLIEEGVQGDGLNTLTSGN